MKRRVIFRPDICGLCSSAGENVDHVFTGCYVTTLMWQSINRWCIWRVRKNAIFPNDSVELIKFLGKYRPNLLTDKELI